MNSNVVGVQNGENSFRLSSGSQYVLAIYTVTLILIGQPPSVFTVLEMLFCLLIVLIGLIIFMSIVLAYFVNSVATLSAGRNRLELTLEKIKLISKELNLSDVMRKKIARSWMKAGKLDTDLSLSDHVGMLSVLSFNLKLKVAKEILQSLKKQTGNAGTNLAFYALMDTLSSRFPRFFVEFFCSFRLVYFFHENLVCAKGDIADCFWLIQSGSVDVLRDDGTLSTILLSGSAIGIAVFSMTNQRRSSTVRARGTCKLWQLDKTVFDSIKTRFPVENALFEDFFVIVHELQLRENSTLGLFEWERSSVLVQETD